MTVQFYSCNNALPLRILQLFFVGFCMMQKTMASTEDKNVEWAWSQMKRLNHENVWMDTNKNLEESKHLSSLFIFGKEGDMISIKTKNTQYECNIRKQISSTFVFEMSKIYREEFRNQTLKFNLETKTIQHQRENVQTGTYQWVTSENVPISTYQWAIDSDWEKIQTKMKDKKWIHIPASKFEQEVQAYSFVIEEENNQKVLKYHGNPYPFDSKKEDLLFFKNEPNDWNEISTVSVDMKTLTITEFDEKRITETYYEKTFYENKITGETVDTKPKAKPTGVKKPTTKPVVDTSKTFDENKISGKTVDTKLKAKPTGVKNPTSKPACDTSITCGIIILFIVLFGALIYYYFIFSIAAENLEEESGDIEESSSMGTEDSDTIEHAIDIMNVVHKDTEMDQIASTHETIDVDGLENTNTTVEEGHVIY